MSKSRGEEALAFQIAAMRMKQPEREHRFHPERRWRFDFAWPDHMLAVEVEGGVWNGGRHTRGDGFEADAEKYAEAALLGWLVMRFSTGQVQRGVAIRFIERFMGRSTK